MTDSTFGKSQFRRLWQAGLSVLLVAALALPLQAATMNIKATIEKTLTTTDDRFGGCMVWLSVSPSDEGMDCPTGNWVTFSCSGEHASKSSALRMFDSAQMAFALNRNVTVTVDDGKKHNNWCFVSRIDVLGN